MKLIVYPLFQWFRIAISGIDDDELAFRMSENYASNSTKSSKDTFECSSEPTQSNKEQALDAPASKETLINQVGSIQTNLPSKISKLNSIL